MSRFIFFTQEGFTFDPQMKKANNMQILGDGEGADIFEAFKNFKENQSYLYKFAYKKIIACEYVGDMISDLEL